MGTSRDRLVPAPDVQSVARLSGRRPEKLEGPAATLSGGPGLRSRNARPADTTPLLTNEGADVAQSTRGFPRSDSETRDSAVKITPVSSISATVPTTRSVA